MKKKSSGKIIAMISVRNDEHFTELLSESHHAFVLSDDPSTIIKKAFQSVVKGRKFISPRISKQGRVYKKDAYQLIIEKLSKREKEVFHLLAKGYLYKEIAGQLSISKETVKRHVHSIYEKLKVKNRAEALNKAFRK